ncbi:glycosyl hydrolase family 32 [Kineococcus sp. NPDC059986]|jgi:beta-fructofuranosidase|uniref:glycosyl hydrolase family 32 n=1 Tax=Kineococcus sp. NPDC059986 TaxID=3155538 RepID=UPI00344F31B7
MTLDGAWTWDFWTAHDGREHHLFYLFAPTSLGDPDRRHRNARIGHATSPDLRSWTDHGEVLGPRGKGFDATATWTGSVVAGPDGRWRMFYTGSRFLHAEPRHTNVETVGVALSGDLATWTAQPEPVTVADRRWYELLEDGTWPEEAWRDPWVQPAADGDGWDMFVTARARPRTGIRSDDAGVVGHAWSPDLERWEVRPPLTAPGSGFAHLEVVQVATVEDREFLVFSCATGALSQERQDRGERGGIFSLPLDRPLTEPGVPLDVSGARPLSGNGLYSGRVVTDPDGSAVLLAFHDTDADGRFVGTLSDPLPLHVDAQGLLALSPVTAPV